MKIHRTCIAVVSMTLHSLAGDFINLNFERWVPSDPVADDVYGRYDARHALPGWTSETPDVPNIPVSLNSLFLDSAGVSVFSTAGLSQPLFLDPALWILTGRRSVFLQAGWQLWNGPVVGGSIGQVGSVPTGMQSLEFLVGAGHSPFTVTVNGSPATVVALGDPIEWTRNPALRYAVDLQGHSGREVALKFTVRPGADQFHGGIILDELRFSANQVPEPGSWALLLGGLAGLGAWSRWPRSMGGTGALRAAAGNSIHQGRFEKPRSPPDRFHEGRSR